jgi:cytoskeleton protein RodZ
MMSEPEIPIVEPESPGKLLAKARWDLGLSVEDVAAELRLSPRQVAALEDDDYDSLPGMTYVRGYLRNYARLVGVPIDSVLSSRREAGASEQTTTSRIPVQRQLSSSDRVVKFATFLVVAAIIGLVVMWWQGQRSGQVAPTLAPRTATNAPASAEGARTPAAAPAPVEPSTAPAGSPGPGPAAPEVVPGGETQGASAPPQGEAPAAEPTAGASEAAGAEPAPAPPSTGGDLVLRFREDCWTDVRDAEGERLVYRTVTAGETLRLQGTPPYSIFFGNARGVDVEYEGKPVDFSSKVRGVFARFVVGESPTSP